MGVGANASLTGNCTAIPLNANFYEEDDCAITIDNCALDFTVTAERNCVEAKTLTIQNGGYLKAKCADNANADQYSQAINVQTLTLGEGTEIIMDWVYHRNGHFNYGNDHDIFPTEVEIGKVVRYGLQLCGTSVTDRNAADILGDGTSSYNPATQTLTLNGVNTSAGAHAGKGCINLEDPNPYGYVVYDGDLLIHVEGNNTFVNEDYGINFPSRLTIDGPGTLTLKGTHNAQILGLNNNSTLYVYGATVNIEATEYTTAIRCGNLVVEDGATVNMKGSADNGAAQIKNLTMGEGIGILTEGVTWDADQQKFLKDGAVASEVAIGPKEGETAIIYDLAIAETPITSRNCDNIISQGVVSGKVSYDPATSTLTLDNANITEWVGAAQGWLTRNHFTDENKITPVENLTIKLIGTNVCESAEIGIWLDQINVTIMSEDGTGVLQYNNFVDTNTEPEFPMGSCIHVGNLTIDNCTVHAGQYIATQVGDENGKLTVINNGLVSAFDGIGFGSHEFGEGIGIVQPAGATIGESGVDYDWDAKGSQHIVIGHMEETPDPVEPVLAFNKEEVTVTRGDAFYLYAPTLTNPAQLPLTWSSSDETVATVNQNGYVTVGVPGETTISATFAGNEQYLAKTASYRIIVTKPTPRLSFGNYGLTVPFMLRLTQEQMDSDFQYPLVVDIQAKCIFMNLDDVSPVTWSSDNEGIYVDDNFMLHATTAGEAIITVSFAGDDYWAPASEQLKVVIELQEPVEPITEEVVETPADEAQPGEVTTSESGIVMSLGEEDIVNTEEGSITMTSTMTTDEVKDLLETVAPGTTAFEAFKGFYFLLAGGKGYVDIDIATYGDYVMNVIKGNETLENYVQSTRGTVHIEYNETNDTWMFIYPGISSAAGARSRRAPVGGAIEGGLVIYQIKIVPQEGPVSILDVNAVLTPDGTIYDLQGRRLGTFGKGVNIVNGRKVVVK